MRCWNGSLALEALCGLPPTAMSRESLFANRVCSVRVRTVSSAPAPRADVGRTINVRLADFIRRDIERVIAKWEEFAATR